MSCFPHLACAAESVWSLFRYMFFDGWKPIVHVLVLGPLGYVALILLLRVSGKRTLSKMNAFDFVITIALGSVFATLLLSKDATLAAGVTAFAVLIGMQFLVTLLSVRSDAVQRIVKAQPTLLYYDGQLLDEPMRRERVTREEIEAAVREQGIPSMDRVRAVILETNSDLSVITGGESAELETLTNVGR